MEETMLLGLLDEIDSMTSEEYWDFFNESQRLPEYLLDWEPVPVVSTVNMADVLNNILFSTE